MSIFLLVLVVMYFLPTIIAFSRHKRNKGAIFALNFFLGLTMIGWVVALVWSLMQDEVVVVTKKEGENNVAKI